MSSHRFLAFLVLLLVLCSLSLLSANVFVSIDCGAAISFKDASGIVWTGDSPYVETGESRSVEASNSFNHVMDTLRVFTNQKKNCYNIDTMQRGRILLRAFFFYGNYDGKSSPPSFRLSFDGNDWASVVTSITEPYYYEVIYVMKKDSISVCVSQSHEGQFPFMTAITVRSLEPFSYQMIDNYHPLFLSRRVAFGSVNVIMFPDDPYDRYWGADEYANGSIKVSSNALFRESVFLDDRAPRAVLKNAITAATSESNIDLSMGFHSTEFPVYINWYFSEVRVLKPNEIRSFKIYKDNKPYSPRILPPYENCTEFSVSGVTVSSSNTTFSVVPTADSTLPPLINAMEVFYIGDPLTDGTNTQDVKGLASLQNAFSALQDWSGDPCLPFPFSWDWIECSRDIVPRVTRLSLEGYGLSGLLPDFRSMDALIKIDLRNNKLQGPIPDFLGFLPKLQILNLGNNQFNGTIPPSLSARTGLNLTVDGNPSLCLSSCSTPAKSSAKRRNSNVLEMILASIIPLIFIFY